MIGYRTGLRPAAPVAVALVVAAAACSSGDDGVSPEVAQRLSDAVEQVETADGLHVDMQILYYGGGVASDGPDQSSCVATSHEPAAASASGERLYVNVGTPHENFESIGCLPGTSFTVDGTRVYAHTDERAPGTELGLLSRVGETTPELVSELADLETNTGTELARLVETASDVEDVDDLTVVFDLDPDEAAALTPAGAETDEPADAVRVTAVYDRRATDRLESLEFEVTAGDERLLIGYHYDAYNQPQDVEIPTAPYITPEVTQLTTLDELATFVGLQPG